MLNERNNIAPGFNLLYNTMRNVFVYKRYKYGSVRLNSVKRWPMDI